MPIRCISVINHKGGVGKTTTAVNLACALAADARRVLLIDYDPQGNASDMVGLPRELVELDYGSNEFTLQRGPFKPQRDVVLPGLDVLPATDELSFLEQEFFTGRSVLAGPGRWLHQALETIKDQYDFVIIDCAPTMGLLAVNAMVAAPEILIPVKLAPADLTGALRLQRSVEALRRTTDPKLRIMGVLGTFYQETSRVPREILGILRDKFGELAFKIAIHQGQALATASQHGRPICSLNPNDRGAVEYELLAQEVDSRGN